MWIPKSSKCWALEYLKNGLFIINIMNICCFQTENPFRRTIQYAISLGGDTDTIANMAGAIAGAYYGYSTISENLQKHCEATEQFIAYADKLHMITASK